MQEEPTVQVTAEVDTSIDEEEDVVLPEGANHSIWLAIRDFLFSIFKFIYGKKK